MSNAQLKQKREASRIDEALEWTRLPSVRGSSIPGLPPVPACCLTLAIGHGWGVGSGCFLFFLPVFVCCWREHVVRGSHTCWAFGPVSNQSRIWRTRWPGDVSKSRLKS
ncbi:hypothetical protein MN608_04768 [Microdochium nivale]|nr:hypothetical protein MN608_04768 [Microdochium nivale]